MYLELQLPSSDLDVKIETIVVEHGREGSLVLKEL
jgi:hypothetical protein